MNWKPAYEPKMVKAVRLARPPAVAEDAEPDQRVGGARLDQQEGGGEDGHHDQRAEGPQARPARALGLGQGEDQQQQGAGTGDRAGHVVPGPATLGRGLTGEQADREDQRQQGDRDGHQERPAPAGRGEQAAEHQAEREAAGAAGGVDAERAVAGRALGEGGGDDGQAGRRGEGGADPLEEAGADQQSAVVHQAAEQGGAGEHGECDQEDPPASEQVGRASAEQQQAAVAEHVAADHPLQGGGGEVQVRADGGQGDADHGDVEGIEEHRGAQDDQGAPEARAPPGVRLAADGGGMG